jgi:hypothetical protein
MITKTRLTNELASFGENINIDELLDRMIFIEKLEERIEMAKTENGISEDSLKTEMEKWFK